MAGVGSGIFAGPARPELEQAMELLTRNHYWLLGETDHEDEAPALSTAPHHDPAAGLRDAAERLGLARLDYRPG
jgi:hypothetical protein